MNVEQIIQNFKSEESHAIWESTWEILGSNDVNKLKELKEYIPQFKQIVASVDMSGGFRDKKQDVALAFTYIEKRCAGACRCFLYSGQNMFNPISEQKAGYVKVLSEEVKQELYETYETHYEVDCTGCDNSFLVKEIMGWHVPVYEWSRK